MRGFFLGTLGLVGLYVALQAGASSNIAAGGKLATTLFGRLSDPTVAGIRQTLHGGIGVLGTVPQNSPPFTVPAPSGGGGGGKQATPNAGPLPAPSNPVLFT